ASAVAAGLSPLITGPQQDSYSRSELQGHKVMVLPDDEGRAGMIGEFSAAGNRRRLGPAVQAVATGLSPAPDGGVATGIDLRPALRRRTVIGPSRHRVSMASC